MYLQRMDLNGDGLVSMEEFLQVTLQDDSYCQSISAFSNVLIWIFRELLLSWNNSTILCVHDIQECWEYYDLFLAKPHEWIFMRKKIYKHGGFLAEKAKYISVKIGNNGQKSPI